MPSLTDILHRGLVWKGADLSRAELPGIPTGFAALDAELPGGGWPQGVLTELLPEHEGIGEVRSLGPALAHLSDKGHWLAWIEPPYLPYAPALKAAGIDLTKVMIVRTKSPKETLWAIEQALQSHACGAVLAWPDKISFTQLRRLQISAEGCPALAFLFRPPIASQEASPAGLRMHLQSIKGELAVRILKRRGGPLARPILLTPSPVIDPPVNSEFPIEHEIHPTPLDSPLPSAPAARIVSARLVHS
jgi:cell division inhibitor SulA/protein ImuA